MKTNIPDLSQMASEKVVSQNIKLNGQRILFDTKVLLMPTSIEKQVSDE